MDELVELIEIPAVDEVYMIVGWNQWADAGAISSGLPAYLVDHLKADKIGEIKPDGFYLFQVPGTHDLLRPQIRLHEGYRQELRAHENEFFYAELGGKGLVIFIGEEPHQNHERYAEALLDAVEALGVRRVVAVGGVYGAMPYDKDREISCVYSLPRLKAELERYAVKFSNYEGGSTIGTYMVDRAEYRDIEFLVFYGFVPSYDFSELSMLLSGMRIENDYRAWFELLKRVNFMFGMDVDLEELEIESEELTASMDQQIAELDEQAPRLKVHEYLERLASEFTERPFMPMDDLWTRELRDLFDEDE
jgi:predicted ATP-grasp superfamily ATP-dependent carboligase